MRIRPRLLLLLLAGLPCQAAFAWAGPAESLRQCITRVATELPLEVAATMPRIDGAGRQALALRSYLRNREALASRWSWSVEQIAAFAQSAEHRAIEDELTKVTQQFESANPGYTLYINREVRSLDDQLGKWNSNASVASAAQSLEATALRQLPSQGCADAQDTKAFSDFLTNWWPSPVPTLAAPGLSRHGQARAFDFQVKRGAAIVAGTDSKSSRTVWDAQGWTEKLRSAVATASHRFSGPLKTPYEPWHYEYQAQGVPP